MSLRFSMLALAAGALAPMAVAQSATDCSNTALSTGVIPASHLAECGVVTSPVLNNFSPSDLSGGVWNNGPDGNAFVSFVQSEAEFTVITPDIAIGTADAFINAGDFAGNDRETWYFGDNEGNVGSVSTSTGTVTTIGTTGETAALLGMSWDPSTQTMYVSVDTPGIGVMDLTTGAVTDVVATDGPSFIGIAHSTDGTLYGIDIGTDALYTVDAATGVTTEVGALGVDANFGQGIDFDEEDGTLYYYAVLVDGGTRTPLCTIDTDTGAVSEGPILNGGLVQMGSGSSLAINPVASEAGAEGSMVSIGETSPNPAAARATVPFTLQAASDVTLTVFDVLGRQVSTLAEGAFAAGSHDATLDASALSPGTYVVRLQAGATVVTRTLSIAR